jgi:glutamate dehydrogenase/leucine dehydrogenase
MDASQVRADIVGVNALGSVLNDKTVPAYVASGTHQGKRKIIAEGANLAETSEGARLLDRHRGRLLAIAGDLANLGGVHVSDLEAVQNMYNAPVTSVRAQRSLLGTMRSGWNRAMKIADERHVTERQAIELAAVDGMMKRSLHLAGAPTASLEKRAFTRQQALTALGGSLGGPGKAPPRRPPSLDTKQRAGMTPPGRR